jgi:predicted lipoprotein with Yx(FWY)xxD motif
VTTTEFEVPESIVDPSNTDSVNATSIPVAEEATSLSESLPISVTARVLSAADSRICTALMTRLIEHFTPTLFTAPAASHMKCTDAFAGSWLPLVIQPAIENDGVYKPLETLQRIKEIDWEAHGLCSSCTIEKREEWTEEQRNIWDLIDSWLESK